MSHTGISLIFLALLGVSNADAEQVLPKLSVTEIHAGVYLHKSYQRVEDFGLLSANGLVVIDGKRAFIIDTPWSKHDTKNLLRWINEKGYDVAGGISTHSHDDRTAGIGLLNSLAIPTYISTQSNELLERDGKDMAVNAFDSSPFELFDGNMEAFYPGGGHTIDNIVVWLPTSKLLFGGCFVRSLQAKTLGYTGEAAIHEWPSSALAVISRYPEAEIVIPGHGNHGNASLLTHTRKLAEEALAQTREVQ